MMLLIDYNDFSWFMQFYFIDALCWHGLLMATITAGITLTQALNIMTTVCMATPDILPGNKLTLL